MSLANRRTLVLSRDELLQFPIALWYIQLCICKGMNLQVPLSAFLVTGRSEDTEAMSWADSHSDGDDHVNLR